MFPLLHSFYFGVDYCIREETLFLLGLLRTWMVPFVTRLAPVGTTDMASSTVLLGVDPRCCFLPSALNYTDYGWGLFS